MVQLSIWDEPLAPAILTGPSDPLSEKQLSTLWSMFIGIDAHWRLDFPFNLLRSRWLDMIAARRAEQPDYTAEYANAAAVFDALVESLGNDAAVETMYFHTKVLKSEEALTRLGHAKFYVGNDFVRCFIACGGFRGFVPKARNYTGFMGGSRFREWPPVRTQPRP